jgi:UDP-N-acetylmuramate dehydrogenase
LALQWSFPDMAGIAGHLRALGVRVEEGRLLSTLGTWRIGGPADLFCEPASVGELQTVLRLLRQENIPVQVIGGGSNILFDDAGFRGAIVRIGRSMATMNIGADGRVTAGAGIWVPDFVRRVASAGWAGCAHAIGIPGTLGGLVLMNGGSQRKGIGDHLVSVTILNEAGDIEVLSREDCAFSYRHSALQGREIVIVEASFQFCHADRHALRREMLALLKERRLKFPRKWPNCGSVFLSDPKHYARVGPPGKMIEDAGLKGLRRGDAQVSPLHANFIINTGQARSADVLGLIDEIRTRVHSRTDFWLECEVRHLAADGRMRPAHLSADALARA